MLKDGHWLVHRTGSCGINCKWAEDKYKPSMYPPFPHGSRGHIVGRAIAEYVACNQDELINYQGEDVSLGIWIDESPFKMHVQWHTHRKMISDSSEADCRDHTDRMTTMGDLAMSHGQLAGVLPLPLTNLLLAGVPIRIQDWGRSPSP